MRIERTRIEIVMMALVLLTLIGLAFAPKLSSMFGPQYQNPKDTTENPVVLPLNTKHTEANHQKATAHSLKQERGTNSNGTHQ